LADAQDLGSCTERCRGSTPLSCIPLLLAAMVSLSACTAPARADSLTISTGGGGAFTFTVQIDRIEDGQVFYQSDGQEKSRPVAEVAAMKLDEEPDYNAGAAAYDHQDWPAAADSFLRTMNSTDRQWLRDWIAPRLLDAANHAGRFDAAVAGWVRLVRLDATANADKKPDVPADGNHLDQAATELNAAAKTATGPSRRLILGLLLEVQTARQDTADAAAVARQLQQMGVSASAAGAGAIASVEQETRIALARTALHEGKFDEAIAQIDSAASILTDPDRQSDALFVRAQALEGKAAGGGAGGRGADAWKDAALGYMRVYVHFRDGPGSEHAAAALMKTAEIEEQHLGDPAAALGLYQKVVTEYKDGTEAAPAATEAARLAAAAPQHEEDRDR
jgi:tetratricopeptide (TPR) repeat protein